MSKKYFCRKSGKNISHRILFWRLFDSVNTVNTKLKYFAAANGYSGFRSYFASVFNREEYRKVYILKGGPGTGKSSFMKKILSVFEGESIEREAIFCSSDPKSLDGVILKKGNVKVAVIDGTAPHSADAFFPGAVDKIINLGDCWDEKLLKNNSEIIIKLNKRKNECYNNAYEYLRLCGLITEFVDYEIKSRYEKGDEETISEIRDSISAGNNRVQTRLISSFGKEGFGRLNTVAEISDNVICAVGVYGSEYVFTQHLVAALNHKKADYIHFPSALDGKKTYGVYLPDIKTAVIADNAAGASGAKIVDTSRFLDITNNERLKCKLEFLWKEREVFLWNSADEFRMASDEHFALEKLYTAAMDFEKAKQLSDEVAAEIKEIFSTLANG